MSTHRPQLFLEGPIGRSLFRLAVPITLANLLQAGYQLTDAFWVGRLGATAVAAVAISFPATFLVIALGSGLAIAGATLSAQYVGARRPDLVNHIAAQTLTMVTLTSLVLSTAGILLAPHLLDWLKVEPAVYDAALSFLRVALVGTIFVFIFMMFQAIMRGIGQTTVPLLIVLGTVLLNFVLDPLFIFGWGPFPAQGVRGAALATLATQAIAAAIGMTILFRGNYGVKIRLRDFWPDPAYLKRAFLLGLPGSIELSTRGLGVIVLSFLVASFGTVTIASYGVGANILQFVMIPAMGLSMAVSTLVGQNMGAGNLARAQRVTILGAVWGFMLLTCVGALAFAFAPHLVAFFVPDEPEVIAEASHFIRVMCLAWGGMGVQLCLIAAFRASGNMLIAMVIALVSQFMLQFPLAYILAKHTSLAARGIWWSFPVTNVIVAIVAIIWFAMGTWKETDLTADARIRRRVTDETISEDGLPPA